MKHYLSNALLFSLAFSINSFASNDLQIIEEHKDTECVSTSTSGCAKSRLILNHEQKILELQESQQSLKTELDNIRTFSTPDSCKHFNENGTISFLTDTIKIKNGPSASFIPYSQIIYMTVAPDIIYIHTSYRSREIRYSSFSSLTDAMNCMDSISQAGVFNK